MKKICNFIVEKRNIIFIVIMVLTVISAFFIPKVKVNYDLSKYLPKESNTSKGIKIMSDAFGEKTTLNIMVENVDQAKANEIYQKLLNLEDIQSVSFNVNAASSYQNENALYVVSIAQNEYSAKTQEVLKNIESSLENEKVYMSGNAASTKVMNENMAHEMPIILAVAIVLIFIILLIVCTSYLEPFIFLFTCAVAIIINYGSNIIFGDVSFITFSIAAILQLALSMDYAIMLLHRYHDEQKKSNDNIIAMKKALRAAFNAITSSSLATIFGLLAMVVMSFTIGKDIGLVIAKGILINVIFVLTLLPALILGLNKFLNKTKKKTPNLDMKWLVNFANKGKYLIVTAIVILIVGAYFIQDNLNLQYGSGSKSTDTEKIEAVFGHSNDIVILYKDDVNNTSVLDFIDELKKQDKIKSVTDYATTVGAQLTAEEMSKTFSFDQKTITSLYQLYSTIYGKTETIGIYDFVEFIKNNVLTNNDYSNMFSNEAKTAFQSQYEMLNQTKVNLDNNGYRRMVISTDYELESKSTFDFIKNLRDNAKSKLGEDSFVLGESSVNFDTKESFMSENALILVITIVSMLLIIGLSFKSIAIPIILVFLIQGAIWISMCLPVLLNQPLFFLAYIIIQCIQMGATIDYAILFTSNYVEHRNKSEKLKALKEALNHSITTILTSSSILIVSTFVISKISTTEMIQKIAIVICRGTIISTLCVLFVLPSLLLVFDKVIEKTTNKAKFIK